MNSLFNEFMQKEFLSKATIVDSDRVEVVTFDNEIFTVYSQIGRYTNDYTRDLQLHILEAIFDENYKPEETLNFDKIFCEAFKYGVVINSVIAEKKQTERTRIGERIRQIREERGLDARTLAKIADIDAANLSRIENGKYSVGLDVLARIATALGKKIDFVDL